MKVALSKLKYILAKGIKNDSVSAFQDVAIDLYAAIKEHTPVDTGRAYRNWNISTNHPDYSIDNANGTDINLKEFEKVFISNGLPYIQKLNNGYSDQRPNGIINPAIAKVRNQKL